MSTNQSIKNPNISTLGAVNRVKIGVLYLLLGAGGLWHLLNVFQEVMRILASPIMFGLGVWLFWECWQIYSQRERLKFALWGVGIVVASFGIEWLGVRTGKIFGSYVYGQTLQPSIAGVPISIGCAWFVMLIASMAVAQAVAPNFVAGNLVKLSCFVALLMVCFDLLMEPAAVKLNYWIWVKDYIPVQNYLAWFGLSFVFTTVGLRIGLFRQLLPRIAFHSYFAQLVYFGLVCLNR